MSRILDRSALGGDLPLQDHRQDVDPHLRAGVFASRIVGREKTGAYEVEGHGESTSTTKTIGDLQGGFHVPQEKGGERKIGSWFFAGAVVLAEASKRPAPKPNASFSRAFRQTTQTRTKAAAPGPRTAKVRLIRNEDWDEDDRYTKELTASIHPSAPDLPKGSPAVLLQGTEERSQELLLLPLNPGALRAVHRGPDNQLSSTVYDTNSLGEDDDRWNAKLHKFWRVARLGPRCDGDGPTQALAWKLEGPTRGLVVDTPSAGLTSPVVEVAKDPAKPNPGSTNTPPASSGGTSYGGVYTLDQLRAQQEERARDIAAGRVKAPTSNYGGVTILGGTRTRDQSRTAGSTATRGGGGQVSTPRQITRPTTGGAAPLVYALTSAKAGGFLDVGEARDPHRVGMTEDGNPINAAHISTGALFRGGAGDGPLDFELGYQERTTGFSERSPVHLKWDPTKSHTGPCGETLVGAWSWVAEVPFSIAEDDVPRIHVPGGGIIGYPPGPIGAGGGGGGGSGGGGNPPPFGPGPYPYGPYGPGGPDPTLGGGTVADCHTTPGRGGENALPGNASGPARDRDTSWAPRYGDGTGYNELETGSIGGLIGAAGELGASAGNLLGDLLGAVVSAGSLVGGKSQPAGVGGGNKPGAGVRVGNAGGNRGAQKRGSRYAALAAAKGLKRGEIDDDGSLRLNGDRVLYFMGNGTLDEEGKLKGAEARIGDSPARRLEIMGGVLQKTVALHSGFAVSGGVILKAQPWAKGEIDPGSGGFLDTATRGAIMGAPNAVAMVGLATGTGKLDGFRGTKRHGATNVATSPLSMTVRGELSTGEGLRAILAGDYATGGRLAGTVCPATQFYPEGVSKSFYGSPDMAATTCPPFGTGVEITAGPNGSLEIQTYSGGVAGTGAMSMDGTGTDFTGGLSVGGSAVLTAGGVGGSSIGGDASDGAVTISADTSKGATTNATSWTMTSTSYTVYGATNKPLVIKCASAGAFTLNGTISGDGRGYIEPA